MLVYPYSFITLDSAVTVPSLPVNVKWEKLPENAISATNGVILPENAQINPVEALNEFLRLTQVVSDNMKTFVPEDVTTEKMFEDAAKNQVDGDVYAEDNEVKVENLPGDTIMRVFE